MNKFFAKNEKGFMALVSVTLITASFIILFLGMFFYATEESARTLDRERSMIAYSLANSCAEIGLQELKDDFYYIGETVTIDGEECTVSVENYGFYGKTLTAEGSVFDHERKIQVAVNTENWPTMEIVDWQDVSEFNFINNPVYSLEFDGGGDYVDLGSPSELNITGDITISYWVKPASAGNSAVISWANSGYSNFPFHQCIDTDYIRFNGGVGGKINNKEGGKINEGKHVAMTVSGTELNFYVNGASDTGNPFTLSTDTREIGDGTLTLSREESQFLDGRLSSVRVYNRALTESEVVALSNLNEVSSGLVGYWKLDEGTDCNTYDSSGYSNNGVLNPDCPTTSPDWIEDSPY